MICQTIKNGQDCSFMTKKGCGFNGGSCNIIVEACGDCGKIFAAASGQYCKVYPNPAIKWTNGKCPTASHIKLAIVESTQKINPLKASKRGNKGK
ncbi:MAG: PxxKW family cysteine-rich protein [Syntrophales bacterium]